MSKMLKYAIYALNDYKGDNPVRDHCHVTGKYRGSAHTACNRSFRLANMIPVIFHNLRGYDGYLIIEEIEFNMTINVFLNSMEKIPGLYDK